MSINQSTTTIKGRTVRYAQAGPHDARPVILLHGNVGDAAFHWHKLIPELATTYHVIAPDLPGFGGSDKLPQTTFSSLINWLDTFFEALNIESAPVVGTSVGGLIARLFAAGYPSRVPALVLINGGGLPSKPPFTAQLIARLPGINRLVFGGSARQLIASREALNWLAEPPETVTENLTYTPQDVITEDMVTAAQNNLDGLITLMRTQVLSPVPEARTPLMSTLILWGENDDISPLSVGKRVQHAIPGAELTTITGTRHAPHIAEPDIVAFQIERFLENLNAPPKSNLGGVGMLG